jgi:hypothetical protein
MKTQPLKDWAGVFLQSHLFILVRRICNIYVYMGVWMLVLHLDLSVRALRLHGHFRRPFAFTHFSMA